MSVFMTAKQLKTSAKKIETATQVFECILLSSAYQLVVTGQIGMVDHLKSVTAMRGYGSAGKKLLAHLKVTDQQVKAGKLGEKGKEHFSELRATWEAMGDEQGVYEHLKEIAFAKVDKDTKTLTSQEKAIKYLAKLDIEGFTSEQKLALRAFTATLVDGDPIDNAPAMRNSPVDRLLDIQVAEGMLSQDQVAAVA